VGYRVQGLARRSALAFLAGPIESEVGRAVVATVGASIGAKVRAGQGNGRGGSRMADTQFSAQF
jgi:hypothetical protein